jgi:uncharacterized protein (TIGR03083 family)
MTTRLSPARYLELFDADASRLLSVVNDVGLQAPVPTCPGWSVRDLVEHVAEVYQHKIACTRQQRDPEGWPPPVPPGDPRQWLAHSRAELLQLLIDQGPDAPSYTWWPEDQTVGFWYRRMAQETAVHRVDAESALGAVTPVAADLAVDGMDEVLMIMLEGDWSDMRPEDWKGVSPEAGAGKTVAVLGGDAIWRVQLRPDGVGVEIGAGPADASVGGDPSELLLWLWGRRPVEAVQVSGDHDAVTALRDRLVLATE